MNMMFLLLRAFLWVLYQFLLVILSMGVFLFIEGVMMVVCSVEANVISWALNMFRISFVRLFFFVVQ